MIRIRPAWIAGLGTVFTATVLAYSFCQPFLPGAVCSAIPAEATFVFQAQNLEELLHSPVSEQLNKALGGNSSLEQLLKDNTWVALTAASEIAVADIPFRTAGRSKSWAAASWVGWRSPWLRWKLEGSRNPKLKWLGKHAVWPIWHYDADFLANGMTLTFALTDNLLIACLSERPSDILTLLDAYDNRGPRHKTP